MEWAPTVIAVVSVILGLLGTITAATIGYRATLRAVALNNAQSRERWDLEEARRHREAGEAAARKVAEQVGQAVELFSPAQRERRRKQYGYDRTAPPEDLGPTHEELAPVLNDIRRRAIEIPDEGVREAVTNLALVLEQYDAISRWGGDRMALLVYNSNEAALDILGAFIRDEPVLKPSGREYLTQAASVAKDYWETQRDNS